MNRTQLFSTSQESGPLYNALLTGIKVILLGYVLSFFALSFIAVPQADDWCFASTARYAGMLDGLVFWYLNWTGIYTTTAVLSTPIFATNIHVGVPIVSVFCFLLTIGSVYFLAFSVTKEHSDSSVLTLFGVSTFLANMPDASQGYYWVSSAASYLVSLSLFALSIALILEIESCKSKPIIRKILLVAVCFLLPGAHGAIGVAATGGYLLYVFLLYLIDRKLSKSVALAAFSSMVGTLIVVASPGNAARLGNHADKGSLFDTLYSTLQYSIAYGAHWMLEPSVWAAVACLCSLFFARSNSWLTGAERKKFLVAITSGLAIIFALIGLPLWAIGAVPNRLMNFAYFVFLLVLFSLVLGAVYRDTQGSKILGALVSRPFFIVANFMFVLSLFASHNFQALTNDLALAQAFLKEAEYRRAELARAESSKENPIRIERYSTPVKLLVFQKGDLEPESDWFANKCAAEYYNVQSIIGT
ncbi:MAG: DUF6056 family protein [Pseudomonadota bacterium]